MVLNINLKNSRAIILIVIILWILAGIFLFVYGKISIQIYLNGFNNLFFDSFFKYFTFLGSGWTAMLLILFILLFVNLRWAIILTIANVASGIIVQVMKIYIFKSMMRPAEVLKNVSLHFVQGVDLNYYNSFPSGHTTTAFCLFFGLALLISSRSGKWLFFIVAWLIAFSRIYLSQHFLSDVIAGSMLGTIIFILTFLICNRNFEKLNKPLLPVFKT